MTSNSSLSLINVLVLYSVINNKILDFSSLVKIFFLFITLESYFNSFIPDTRNSKQVCQKSADPDKMPHKAAYHQGLQCLLR